ncbi:hypothetical protein RZN05_15410 [Sphingomonas sp. HF-S4]|uniref:Uncharacterized protein n=1 Tax=Sphingomonas agrestis TaxID=3080540 RepID=A0ABU3YAF9_9SPHN|nr:hypothetical protein [Sphingomonas sp. HF-S4]MDV3458385.1 hypothetical protein [Sphingomonas sp. HF-S4]
MLLFLVLQASPIPKMPELPTCSFEQSAKLVERKTDLPGDVSAEVERQFGFTKGIAEAGDYFESTDNIRFSDAPRARFLRAYSVGKTWLIWFEKGGSMASGPRLIALAPPSAGGSGPGEISAVPNSYFAGNLCAASRAFLAGVRGVSQGG